MSDRLKHLPLDILTKLIPKDKELTEDQISETADRFYQNTISSLKEENIDLDKLIQIILNNSNIDKDKLLSFFTDELENLQGNFDEDAYNIQISLGLTADNLKDTFKTIVKQANSEQKTNLEDQAPSTAALEVSEQPTTTSIVEEAPANNAQLTTENPIIVTKPTEDVISKPEQKTTEQIENEIKNAFKDGQDSSQYELLNKILNILPNTDYLIMAISYLDDLEVSDDEKEKLIKVINILYESRKNAEITEAQFKTGGITVETLDRILFYLADAFGIDYSKNSEPEKTKKEEEITRNIDPHILKIAYSPEKDKSITYVNDQLQLINPGKRNILLNTKNGKYFLIKRITRDLNGSVEFIELNEDADEVGELITEAVNNLPDFQIFNEENYDGLKNALAEIGNKSEVVTNEVQTVPEIQESPKEKITNSLDSLIASIESINLNPDIDDSFKFSKIINRLKYIKKSLSSETPIKNENPNAYYFINDPQLENLNNHNYDKQTQNGATLIQEIINLIINEQSAKIESKILTIKNIIETQKENYIDKSIKMNNILTKLGNIDQKISRNTFLSANQKSELARITLMLNNRYYHSASEIQNFNQNSEILKKYGIDQNQLKKLFLNLEFSIIFVDYENIQETLDALDHTIENEIKKAETEKKRIEAQIKQQEKEKNDLLKGLSGFLLASVLRYFGNIFKDQNQKDQLIAYMRDRSKNKILDDNKEPIPLGRNGISLELNEHFSKNQDNRDFLIQFYTDLKTNYFFNLDPKSKEQNLEILINLQQLIDKAINNSDKIDQTEANMISNFVENALQKMRGIEEKAKVDQEKIQKIKNLLQAIIGNDNKKGIRIITNNGVININKFTDILGVDSNHLNRHGSTRLEELATLMYNAGDEIDFEASEKANSPLGRIMKSKMIPNFIKNWLGYNF